MKKYQHQSNKRLKNKHTKKKQANNHNYSDNRKHNHHGQRTQRKPQARRSEFKHYTSATRNKNIPHHNTMKQQNQIDTLPSPVPVLVPCSLLCPVCWRFSLPAAFSSPLCYLLSALLPLFCVFSLMFLSLLPFFLPSAVFPCFRLSGISSLL